MYRINANLGEPIYRQLVEQIERFIVSGVLTAGDEIPSVRQLATYLDINPMTISKAFGILEAKNLLERRRGRGMFVAGQHQKAENISQRLELIRPLIQDVILKSRQLAISDEAILKLIKSLLKEKNNELGSSTTEQSE
jgi:GntR family transcriptional regulator